MIDQLLQTLGSEISKILDSPIVKLGLEAIAFYFVLLWAATAYWAYRDLQTRTTNPVAPYLAAALIIIFTPILFLFGVIVYRILRPRETVGEANERALAEEAMMVEIEAQPHLRELRPSGPRGLDHLPHVPQQAAPRVPQLLAPGGARLVTVRMVRQGLRAARCSPGGARRATESAPGADSGAGRLRRSACDSGDRAADCVELDRYPRDRGFAAPGDRRTLTRASKST